MLMLQKLMATTATVAVVFALMRALGPAAAGSDESTPGAYHDLPRVSAATPFLADCNGPNFPITAAYINAESEPYIAVNPSNPDNLIVVYHEDRYPNDGANGVLAATSFDGGRTWQVPKLQDQPEFSRCAGGTESNGGNFEKASDPYVAFGPDGTAYFAAISWNHSSPEEAQFVSTSTDGGRSWGHPVAVIRASDPDVSNAARSVVAPDPTREHTAYLVWARRLSAPASEARGAVGFSRTTDGGETWSEAGEIYQTPIGMGTSANKIVVMPNGDLVNVFSELPMGTQPDRSSHPILAIHSTDGGSTWSKPITVATAAVAGIVDPRTGARVRTGSSFNDIAVDPRPDTNTMYAVWEDARFTQERTEQIAFAKSTDGGRTWADPVAVSTDQEMQNFIPSVAVNDRGDVAVAWYGFAAAKSATRALETRYWIAFSKDEGQTWSAQQPVTSRPFDLRTAPYNTGFFFGEYQGLTAAGRYFFAAMTLANGRSLDNRTDIYSCTVSPDDHMVPYDSTGTVCAAPGVQQQQGKE